MTNQNLRAFFAGQAELIRQAKGLSELLREHFVESQTVYLREAETGISNAGEDWSLVSLSYDKDKVLSCTNVPDSDLSAPYRFDEGAFKNMCQCCYLFGLPPPEGISRMKKYGAVVAETLHPPTLDEEVKRLLLLQKTREALDSSNSANQTLQHLAFLLILKRRRDELSVVLEGRGTSNAHRAVAMARLWVPMVMANGVVNEVRDAVQFLCDITVWARGIGDKARRLKCPSCKGQFSEADIARSILDGGGLVFSFCTASGIDSYSSRNWMYACPICSNDLDRRKLKEGEYDASKPLCFVASTVFGSDSWEVSSLQDFRDRVLLNYSGGRTLIRAYYRVGPRAASMIHRSRILESAIRQVLRSAARLWRHASASFERKKV